MTKILNIEYCTQCTNLKPYSAVCRHKDFGAKGRKMNYSSRLVPPSWCPLEDKVVPKGDKVIIEGDPWHVDCE